MYNSFFDLLANVFILYWNFRDQVYLGKLDKRSFVPHFLVYTGLAFLLHIYTCPPLDFHSYSKKGLLKVSENHFKGRNEVFFYLL